MPTKLEEIGSPVVGAGIDYGPQSDGTNNRTITRRFKMRVEDQADYLVSLINPTLYDSVFTGAVIVDQGVSPANKADCVLTRTFAEIPTEWNIFDDGVVTFPGVALSNLYSSADFKFRNGQISLRTQIRTNRTYFLSNPANMATPSRFAPVDTDGVEQSVITDYTLPSADEYIAMVLGRREIVVDSQVKRWRGDIHYVETVFALAK